MEYRPRVALISDYTLSTLGGAENAFYEQVLSLAEQTEVLAVCPPSDRLAVLGRHPRVTALGMPASWIVPGLGFPVTRQTRQRQQRLRQAFQAAGVALVHVHSEFGIAAAAIAAARELGLPVVQTIHTFFWQIKAPIQKLLAVGTPAVHGWMTGMPGARRQLAPLPGDSALRNMSLTVGQHVDRVVSPSAHQAQRLYAAGLRKLDVVPNAVTRNPQARPVRHIDGPLRVLWMGRFSDEKRVLEFIRSGLRALDQVGPQRLQIDLLGTGLRYAAAARIIGDRPGINLVGRVAAADIPQWLARGHVTVLSSIGWDNQPMTVAESITALRGVIWSDPALTEGLTEAGIPAFGHDEDVLTQRLVELAEDPAPVIAASAAAVEARRLFDPATFRRAIFAVYRRAGVRNSSAVETEYLGRLLDTGI